MEGLTAVSVTMIICPLAPGFRQLSKAAIQHLAFPVAMKHSQDTTGRACGRGKQGGLHPHFRHGKAGRWKNVHAQQLQAQGAAPVCDWEPLPSCTAVDTAPHTSLTETLLPPSGGIRKEASGWRHHGWRHCLPLFEQFMGHAHYPVGIRRVSWVGIPEAGSVVLFPSSVGQGQRGSGNYSGSGERVVRSLILPGLATSPGP